MRDGQGCGPHMRMAGCQGGGVVCRMGEAVWTCEVCEGVGHDMRDGCGLHMRMAECWGMTCGMGETVWTHVRDIECILEGGGQQLEHVGCITISPGHARLSQNACAVVTSEGKKVNHVAVGFAR